MSLATPHRVRQQRLQVQVGSPAEALATRLALRAGWSEWVAPALERAFDELAPPGEVVRLSRLELRLCVRDLDDLPRALYQQVYEAARVAIERALWTSEAQGAPAPDAPLTGWLHAGAPGWVQATPEVDTRAILRAEAGAALHTLVQRLRDAHDPVAWARLIRLLGTGDDSPLSQMLHLNDSGSGIDPVARRDGAGAAAGRPPRPAGSPHDAAHEDHLHERSAAGAPDGASAEPHPEPDPPLTAAWARRRLLDDCLRGDAPLTDYGRMVLAAALLAERAPLTGMDALVSVLAACPALVWGAPPPAATLRWLEARLGGPLRARQALPWLDLETWTAPRSQGAADQAAAGRAPAPSPAPATTQTGRRASGSEPDRGALSPPLPADPGPPSAMTAPGTLVPLAGLVLLHPYLSRFLGNRGALASDGKLLEAAQLPRAAALLLALATGRDDPDELDAALVKVLLGLDPQDPLPLAAGLVSAEDWEDIDALLRAVIAHWGALGATSPDGLRGSYLCRNAMLRRVASGWSVQIQPAAWDVLLGRLPWALGVVRLPWMDAPLHVRWEGA